MFGAFRLMLAALVVISHFEIHVFGLHPGIVAVVCFFIVSGYAMSALGHRNYAHDASGFYVDRALRLMPQYLFYLAISATVVFGLGINPLKLEPNNTWIAASLTLVPLDFQYFIPAIVRSNAMPQAWSLGLEAIFYLLLPALLASRLLRAGLIWCSVTVVGAAVIGWLPVVAYGYALPPGALAFFALGMLIERGEWRAIGIIYGALLAVGAVAGVTGGLFVHPCRELLVGMVIGVPAVACLSRCNSSRVDKMLGQAAYGTYLNHFLILWAMQHYGLYDQTSRIARLAAAVAAVPVSVALGWATYWAVERPVESIRRQIRMNRHRNWLPERVCITVQQTEAAPTLIASSR